MHSSQVVYCTPCTVLFGSQLTCDLGTSITSLSLTHTHTLTDISTISTNNVLNVLYIPPQHKP